MIGRNGGRKRRWYLHGSKPSSSPPFQTEIMLLITRVTRWERKQKVKHLASSRHGILLPPPVLTRAYCLQNSPPGTAGSSSRGSSSGRAGPAAGYTPPGGWHLDVGFGCCWGPRTLEGRAPHSLGSGSESSLPPPGPRCVSPLPHRPHRNCHVPPPGSARTSAGCWPS